MNENIYDLKKNFKQKYTIVIQSLNFVKIKSRAHLKCFLSAKSDHLYALNSELGIVCGDTFKDTVEFNDFKFEYLGKVEINSKQKPLISLFNVIFFGVNYKKNWI